MFTDDEISALIHRAKFESFKCFRSGRYLEAYAILKQLLKMYPNDVESLQLTGMIKNRLGQYDGSESDFMCAAEIDPSPDSYNNLALCYSSVGKFNEAVLLLEEALALAPDSPHLYNNLGIQFRHLKNYPQAIESFQKANSFGEKAEIWGLLGGCYGEMKILDEAETCFCKALELDPNFAGAHTDLASVYQLKGEWDKAWPEFEWRLKSYEELKNSGKIYDPEKKWSGQEIKGKRILLYTEQGYGDTIHFFRYVRFMRAKAKIILHCEDVIASLFSNEVDEIYTSPPVLEDPSLPSHDYHCSLLSLPFLLGGPPISGEPYLHLTEKMDLGDYSKYRKIGIVWAGESQHPNDRNRSCHLSNFKGIHEIENVNVFSLMKDKRSRAYRLHPEPTDLADGCDDMKIVDMAPMMTSFEETAKIINSLDLVITVDTAVLHLAGALGIPTWGLLSTDSDWRWTLTGEKTVWYSSVRLFRQTKSGDWQDVFSSIEKQLRQTHE